MGDYDLWKTTLGNTFGNDLRADGNGNNRVDLADYTVWRDHRTRASLSSPASHAIPEPAAASLASLLVSLLLFAKDRKSAKILGR